MGPPPQQVEVHAPSRLHFGMFSFGVPGERQFGGVGVMIDRPGLRLRAKRAAKLEGRGPLGDRVAAVYRRVAERLDLKTPCSFEIFEAPPEHVGLGAGTQVSLAVAAAAQALAGGPPLGAAGLAELAGRAE